MQQSPAMMGWLFFSGATWVSVALGPSSVRGSLDNQVAVWGAVAAAYVVGVMLLWMGRTHRPLATRPAHLLLLLGTLAATSAALGSGPTWIGAVGGFYGYVAAYGFLYMTRRSAIAHLAFAGVAYALAVSTVAIAHPAAAWLLVMGIAVGGAGLVGAVGQKLNAAWQAEQRAADSMREIDQMRRTFLQAVSHELRTPLTAVTGFASTLEQHGDRLSPDQRHQVQQRLAGAAGRLERLLNDLLDIDRIERDGGSASRELVHLPDLIVSTVDQVVLGSARVSVEIANVQVAIEPAKVERIVVNLVANALKHNAYGTDVLVRAFVDACGDLEIRVIDHGKGIAPQIAATLFDPFVQGPGSSGLPQPGTGIGLTIVAQFARLHGGSVRVEPTAGGGATFVVTLPDAAAPGAARREPVIVTPELASV